MKYIKVKHKKMIYYVKEARLATFHNAVSDIIRVQAADFIVTQDGLLAKSVAVSAEKLVDAFLGF